MITLIYLAQASLVLIGLFGAYWFLLRKETFFQLNRLALASIAFIVVLLPMLPIPDVFPAIPVEIPTPPPLIAEDQNGIQHPLVPNTVGSNNFTNNTASPKVTKSIDFKQVILRVYLAGVGLFALRLLFQLILLIRLLAKSPWKRESAFIFVETPQPIKPFSFFSFIVYNPSVLPPEALQQVKVHEQVHSKQLHSLDILLGEFFCVCFWLHPLAWKLAQQIRLNLEYLADQVILEKGFEKKNYQYSLLQVALNGKNLRLTNNFNQSLIKKRIIMMNAKQSPDRAKLKYFLMFPLLLGFVLFFNQAEAQKATNSPKAKTSVGTNTTDRSDSKTTATGISSGKGGTARANSAGNATGISSSGSNANGASAKSSSTPTATVIATGKGGTARANSAGTATGVSASGSNATGASAESMPSEAVEDIYSGEGENIYFIVRSDVDKKTLDTMTEDIAKAGVKVQIPELEYNANGHITRIKIIAESEKGIKGNVYSDNGNSPIEGPVGFFMLHRNERQHFGTITGDPSDLQLPQDAIQFIQGATGYFKVE